MAILVNKIKCLSCGEVLISIHRQDFQQCNCENKTHADGGIDYLKRGGKDLSLIEEQSVYDTDSIEKIREAVVRGSVGKRGNEKLTYVLLKDIDDEWLENIITYEETHRPQNPFIDIYKREQEYRKTL